MTDNSIQKTTVNLDGLLEILGKNLYSSPNIALRELIQNASDACERHRIESKETRQYSIRLKCNDETQQLIISDNGSGLSKQELQEFLATIGSGYSRVLRNKTGSKDIIGYFGLGFLSAYVVAKKVEVVTTSYKSPNETWKFTSTKGKTYSISPAPNSQVGTTVTLYLKDEFISLSHASFVDSLIERYCCLLQIPIFLNDFEDPLNNLQPPWYEEENTPPIRRRKLALDFANVFEDTFEPIVTFRIPNNNELDLKGVLWVQGGSTYASSDNRNISVFIRNMFITDEDKELFPSWAGFCGGVLETNKFQPTASRESLQKDDYYFRVKSYLNEFLASELRRVALEEPAAWRRILSRHNQAMLGAAISSDRLFETIHKSLKIPTTEGDLTIPSLLKRSENKIFTKISSQSGHEEILFRARGIPLVKGYLFASLGFCQKYHAVHGVPIETIGTKSSRETVFPSHPPGSYEDELLFRRLFESEKHEVTFTHFKPHHIPLLVIEDADVITKKRIEDDEADQRISSAALSLARLETKQLDAKRERIIFINLENNLIKKIPYLEAAKQEKIKKLLISLMELLCLEPSHQDQDLDVVFSQFNSALLFFIENGTS